MKQATFSLLTFLVLFSLTDGMAALAQDQKSSPFQVHDVADERTDDQLFPDLGPEPLAVLQFADGYELTFVPLAGADGEMTVGIAEAVPDGGLSRLPGLGLVEASPLQVFHAMAAPGQTIPTELEQRYGGPRTAFGRQQGWARQLSEELSAYGQPAVTDVACSNSWFLSWVPDHLYPHDRFVLDQNATSWSTRCEVGGACACANTSRSYFSHEVHDKDRWTAHVCGRSTNLSSHFWFCQSGDSGYQLANLAFVYRPIGGSWSTAYRKVFPANGALYAYYWYWAGSNWDWRVEIFGVVPNRDFWDIYVGWQG